MRTHKKHYIVAQKERFAAVQAAKNANQETV
jgi:hypothetical protein